MPKLLTRSFIHLSMPSNISLQLYRSYFKRKQNYIIGYKTVMVCCTVFSFLTACHSGAPAATRTLDFGSFTIKTPKQWTAIRKRGFDAYAGAIAIDSTDTLSFEMGPFADDLREYQSVKMEDGKTYYVSVYDSTQNLTLFDSTNLDQITRSRIAWDSIDGRKAKILSQLSPGTGTTGVYIDSLWGSGDRQVRFNLYGTDLNPANEHEVLSALKTLKFHKQL